MTLPIWLTRVRAIVTAQVKPERFMPFWERLIGRQETLVKLEKLQRYGRYDSRILEDAVKLIQGGELT